MYCAPKLKDYKAPEEVDLQISFTQRESPASLCHKVAQVIQLIGKSSTDEADVLRRRIEGYFKDNYLLEL